MRHRAGLSQNGLNIAPVVFALWLRAYRLALTSRAALLISRINGSCRLPSLRHCARQLLLACADDNGFAYRAASLTPSFVSYCIRCCSFILVHAVIHLSFGAPTVLVVLFVLAAAWAAAATADSMGRRGRGGSSMEDGMVRLVYLHLADRLNPDTFLHPVIVVDGGRLW